MATYRINQLPNECRQVILALRAAKDVYKHNLKLAEDVMFVAKQDGVISFEQETTMRGLIQGIKDSHSHCNT